jgi:hypothetical protein
MPAGPWCYCAEQELATERTDSTRIFWPAQLLLPPMPDSLPLLIEPLLEPLPDWPDVLPVLPDVPLLPVPLVLPLPDVPLWPDVLPEP